MTAQQLLQTNKLPLRVKQTVEQLQSGTKVILFGSRARGDYRAESDWDFLILLPQSTSPALEKAIRDQLYELELQTETVISSIIEEEKAWEKLEVTPFFQNVRDEGIEIALLEDVDEQLS